MIPIFWKHNANDDESVVSIEEHLPRMFDEIGKETLQEAIISGLNDYDYRVRLGTVGSMRDYGIMDEDNLTLLEEAYKIETNVWVQNIIESILLTNINEEIAEMFFELLKNFRIDLDDVDSITYREEMYGSNEVLSIFLSKWKKEEDSTIRELIHCLVELLVSNLEGDATSALSKDEVKQLQEMDIKKK